MTTEEMDRALEFVIKQQAQFSTDLQRLERNLSTTVDLLSEVSKTQLRMAEAQIRTESRVAELAEAQKRTNDTLAETNDGLNSLIVVVERYFSNGRRNN
jgi:indole-3-glycerol phosphate synthase